MLSRNLPLAIWHLLFDSTTVYSIVMQWTLSKWQSCCNDLAGSMLPMSQHVPTNICPQAKDKKCMELLETVQEMKGWRG